jgi:hypothetical protein
LIEIIESKNDPCRNFYGHDVISRSYSSYTNTIVCCLPHSFNRNCDRAAAKHYLDMSQGDLDTAVELYISMSESGHSESHSSSASALPTPAVPQRHVIDSDPDSDGYMEIDRDDTVSGASAYAVELDHAIARRDSERQQLAHLQQQRGLFGKVPSRGDSIDPFANYSEPDRSGPLSKMYGMPVFCLNASPDVRTFNHAKAAAASMFKKLIVNVLDQSMVSLLQNRDLWPNDDVAALVVEHFCMFQLHKSSDAAVEYFMLYPLRQGIQTHQLPIIDILDPLTGMLIKRLSGSITARELCSTLRMHEDDDLNAGVSRSSFTSPPMAVSQASPTAAFSVEGGSVWSGIGDGGDEDMARAIAASLGDPDASTPMRPRSPPRAVSSAQKVRDETDDAYKESLMRDRQADEERERSRLAEEQRLVMEKAKALSEAQRIAQEEQIRLKRKSVLQAKFASEPSSTESISLAFRYQIVCIILPVARICLIDILRCADFMTVEGLSENSTQAMSCGHCTNMLN